MTPAVSYSLRSEITRRFAGAIRDWQSMAAIKKTVQRSGALPSRMAGGGIAILYDIVRSSKQGLPDQMRRRGFAAMHSARLPTHRNQDNTGGALPVQLRVLVTGGAGFLGRHISERLLADHDVAIYDDLSSSGRPDALIEKGADFARGDILGRAALLEASRGCDAVVHLAARAGIASSAERPAETDAVNVGGTAGVLECCRKNGIRTLVFASSAAVYGSRPGPIPEDAEARPLSPYGAGKLEAERLVGRFARDGACGISLRIFNAYGPGQDGRRGVVSAFIDGIAGGGITVFGDGGQTRDYVWAADVAEAFALALESGESGTYNVGTGRATTVSGLADMIEGIAGRRARRIRAEAGAHDARHSMADTSLARERLGFEAATGIADGLARLVPVAD